MKSIFGKYSALLLSILITSKGLTQEINTLRGNFRLSFSELSLGDIQRYLNIKDRNLLHEVFLNELGIVTNETSKISIRQETHKIELNCFDCIVDTNNNLDYELMSPVNEEHQF